MIQAAKKAGWIMLGLFVLSIVLGGNPLDNLTIFLLSADATGQATRMEDLVFLAALAVFVGWALKYFMTSVRGAFGKGGGGGGSKHH